MDIKINSHSEDVWSRSFGEDYTSNASFVVQTYDDKYIIIGTTPRKHATASYSDDIIVL